jgi:acrylyl-CoA reductase (NADPH)
MSDTLSSIQTPIIPSHAEVNPAIPTTFKALVLDRRDEQVTATVRTLTPNDLPPGDLLVRVAYASLNYKDALAVTNRGRIVRGYPIVPGVDLAGTVVTSTSPDYAPGDLIVATGRGIGEDFWGGYSALARISADAALRLPAGLDLHQAMVIGTAGYTAMLAMMILGEMDAMARGEIVVTGAAGGVGSFAVALLGRAGHRVVASTGRAGQADYLTGLGASEILPREVLGTPPARAMASARWGGAVDNVGGATLASLIATMQRHGTIAACGLAGGAELQTTVYPFILRGVNLMGVDSNYCPAERRVAAWERLAREVNQDLLDTILDSTVPLEDVPRASEALLAGTVRGRIVVDLGGGDAGD